VSPAPAGLGLEGSYRLIHEGACVLETGRDAVLARGLDSRGWLQGQVSQDLASLEVGRSAETLVLSPQGKIEAYCRAVLLADDAVLLDIEAGYGESLFERLRRFRLRVKVDLEVGTLRCLMVRGPDSATTLETSGIEAGVVAADAPVATLSDEWLIAVPVLWPGYTGFDVLTPAQGPTPPGVQAAAGDPRAFEAARIEAGVPAMGRELTDKTIPQEAGSLVEHSVSFTKGCYTGQELVARLDARGGNVARRLRGVILDTAGDGTVLVSDEREVGRITSIAWSPGFSARVALAYVRRDVIPPAVATTMPGGGSAEIRELPLGIG